jgi:hypothetical protein
MMSGLMDGGMPDGTQPPPSAPNHDPDTLPTTPALSVLREHHVGARDHRVKIEGCVCTLLEPGEIGLLPTEETADGIDQDMIG